MNQYFYATDADGSLNYNDIRKVESRKISEQYESTKELDGG